VLDTGLPKLSAVQRAHWVTQLFGWVVGGGKWLCNFSCKVGEMMLGCRMDAKGELRDQGSVPLRVGRCAGQYSAASSRQVGWSEGDWAFTGKEEDSRTLLFRPTMYTYNRLMLWPLVRGEGQPCTPIMLWPEMYIYHALA
jgi:hypothetical protein